MNNTTPSSHDRHDGSCRCRICQIYKLEEMNHELKADVKSARFWKNFHFVGMATLFVLLLFQSSFNREMYREAEQLIKNNRELTATNLRQRIELTEVKARLEISERLNALNGR